MAIGTFKDAEARENEINGVGDLEKPLITTQDESYKCSDENGSIFMVLFSTFVAVCGAFEFGSCVGYSAPTQAAIREDLGLSLSEFSMFGSILTIGAMIGAVTSGRVADLIGRKGAMRLSAAFCITGWLAVYFSKGALSLDVGRFSTGFGIGVLSFVVPVFIAEIAPKHLRGGLTTLNQLMIVIGQSVAFLIGTVITWRSLALTGLVPCIFLFVGLCFIPESPRWLAKVGQHEEFRAALRKLRGNDADITEEADEILEYIETLESLPKATVWDLFQQKYIRAVIIGVALMVFQQFGGINGISFYASETFALAGLSSGKTGTIAYACVQVPITFLGAILMDRSGRRALIMLSASGTFLGCFLAGSSFYLKEHDLYPEWRPILAVAGVLIYIGSFSIGMGAGPWVIMSEIFPINVKGVAGSLVVLVNWLGAWTVSYTFNFLMAWSTYGTFYIYSGFSLLTILYVAKFVPETKGKTLEEIQACINSH
ncbi:hypothetical protein like AT5G18840 [Hibiscus trionum]|uniref:Major facilitator superfamily (MFS) profile domain-containing protein n=1 Tax=Hibiscus trionum TaxID=183268 RepID=A0A9W7H2C5_HIBTR|nr:hypothetical protein like AT5G18840 [Hibiscus trionum]